MPPAGAGAFVYLRLPYPPRPLFTTFFTLGVRHLTGAGALDHHLFLATVALAYAPSRWRRWIGLASAFALAHAVSVALVAAGLLTVDPAWVEPAIAGSVTALALYDAYHLRRNPLGVRESAAETAGTFALVAAFGLVHGLGFGAGFLAVAGRGLGAGDLAAAVASFTAGVEFAQLLILLGGWILAFAVFDLLQWRPLGLRFAALTAVALAGAWLTFQAIA